LSFCGTWKQVDALACSIFGVEEADPRRLQGAIEEACYRLFVAGHTLASEAMLMRFLEAVLGTQSSGFRWRALIPAALSQGLTNGSFVVSPRGVQPLGPLVMEAMVAQSVAERLLPGQDPQLLSYDAINAVMADYETVEGIVLNTEQRLAVQTAAANAVVLVTGGAGVGKTTVLKALYEIYDRAGVRVIQVALAGRAAKRMQEATGRPASTIASFLRGLRDGDLRAPTVLVVDEASMVDIITMSRICEALPQEVRLVLVGDPSQLMPVGPGLVLHALAGVPGVPLVELKVVKRYGGEIGAAATAIREGIWPDLPADEAAAISFISAGASYADSLAATVLELYEQDPENTQILSSRRNG
ncbi:MAG: AAA family ATPase, partial [Humidesulfovibrio sp.]|nr:AAA family ATPase [Humidesulfovibrio sp.]